MGEAGVALGCRPARSARPLLAGVLLTGMALTALRVVGYGFLPPDDALRHAAKAVCGKDWSDILVLRADMRLDNCPGWHALLGAVHRHVTRAGPDAIVAFSIVFLFVLFSLPPLLALKRPEAWPLALLLLAAAHPDWASRLLQGRPYLISAAALLTLMLLAPPCETPGWSWRALAGIAAAVAAATWVHGAWYLFALPLLACCLAHGWRAGAKIGLALAAGIGAGALLTGQPFVFLRHIVLHMARALLAPAGQQALVGEFQARHADFPVAVLVLGALALRRLRAAEPRPVARDATLVLVALCWLLGQRVGRFWLDWGLPAAAVWLAREIQDALSAGWPATPRTRLAAAAGAAAALYLAFTANVGERWTRNLKWEFLRAENPEHAAWLPEPGGIVYADRIAVFYKTFYANPNASWKYMLGFEAALMPPEDFAVFQNILWNNGESGAFAPWVARMTPADRLILDRPYANRPKMPALEWHYAATDTWIGRKRR